MPQGYKKEARGMRAREPWALYDTILIGSQVPDGHGWFKSFQELAQATELSFFNARNRGEVGAQYCNLDTSELLDFAFEVESIGVRLFAPPQGTGSDNEGVFDQANGQAHLIFSAEMTKHGNLSFTLNQDEKLNASLLSLPAGSGTAGNAGQINYPLDPGPLTGTHGTLGDFNNGTPRLSNRWPFPVPISIPRNHHIKCTIKFSDYGRYMCNSLQGPDLIDVGQVSGPPEDGFVPAIAGIRVSMLGTRAVQLRNAQTFY